MRSVTPQHLAFVHLRDELRHMPVIRHHRKGSSWRHRYREYRIYREAIGNPLYLNLQIPLVYPQSLRRKGQQEQRQPQHASPVSQQTHTATAFRSHSSPPEHTPATMDGGHTHFLQALEDAWIQFLIRGHC